MDYIPQPYLNGQSGCVPDPPDSRDLVYEPVLGAGELPEEYDATQEVGGIKVENQKSSSSCVGQSWSKYAEVLERIENQKFTDLSAKFIYSRIFLPQGGAYIREGAKLMQKEGVCEEKLDPSYMIDGNVTEDYMRQKNEDPKVIENALLYRAKSYANIGHQGNADIVKQAIFQNGGAILGFTGSRDGWSQPGGVIKPPQQGESTFGHAVYGCGFKKINGVEMIKFLNSWSDSWGNQGYGYVSPEYWGKGLVFNIWTLIDQPNVPQNDMLTIVGNRQDGKQYLKSANDNKISHIFNPVILNFYHDFGIVDKDKVQWEADVNGYEIVEPTALIKTS